MTDAEYNAFMTKLNRLTDADARAATPLGRRYLAKPNPAQHETQADHDYHKYNDETMEGA